MDKPTSDDIVAIAELLNIHQRIAEEGCRATLAALQQRERALAAYVTSSADHVADIIRISGDPSTLAEWVKNDMLMRLLVVIEALRIATDVLWKDVINPADDKGTNHDQEE